MIALRFPVGRFAGIVLAAALAVGAAFDARSAAAQGWFGGLFGGGQPRAYSAPDYPGYGRGPDRPYVPRRRTPRRQPVEQAQEPAVRTPSPPLKNATVFVDVFGDTLGQLLANGLDDALADKTEVGVIHLARGPSGLVNEAYFDWPKTIDDLLAHQTKPGKSAQNEPKPAQPNLGSGKPVAGKPNPDQGNRIDVAVMMVGSNDRQPISQDGKKLAPGSDEWNAVYRKRVMAIAEAFQRRKIPLVWVGVPIVKDDDFADDMAALNDIYRDAAGRTGAAYVDTWEPFSDDNGDFSAYGPDINGQNVRLRSADGIYFTKAGARKLAHFVETLVRRDLDGRSPLPELPTVDAPPADAKGNAAKGNAKDGKPLIALIKPEAGPIRNLGEPPATKDGHLADAPSPKDDASRDAMVALIKGQPEAAPAGRADNFRWPADGAGTR